MLVKDNDVFLWQLWKDITFKFRGRENGLMLVLLKSLRLAQLAVCAAVIGVMGWTSVNGLVVVTVGTRAWLALSGLGIRDIVVGSRQRPNHPYSTQDVVNAGVAFVGMVVCDIVVVSRHPPNHPYFTQDVVGISVVELEVEVLVELEVVVSSRHPKNINYSFRKQQRTITYPTIPVFGRL